MSGGLSKVDGMMTGPFSPGKDCGQKTTDISDVACGHWL